MRVSPVEQVSRVLRPPAVAFVEDLTRLFRPRIQALLARRRAAQERLNNGERLDFLPGTAEVRRSEWRVAPIPADLQDRRVEITGPVDRKIRAQRPVCATICVSASNTSRPGSAARARYPSTT
jgi:malate synthase